MHRWRVYHLLHEFDAFDDDLQIERVGAIAGVDGGFGERVEGVDFDGAAGVGVDRGDEDAGVVVEDLEAAGGRGAKVRGDDFFHSVEACEDRNVGGGSEVLVRRLGGGSGEDGCRLVSKEH